MKSPALLVALWLATAAPSEPAAPPYAIDHVSIHVRDLDATVAFYERTFGFRVNAAPFPTIRFLDDGNGLQIHVVGDGEQATGRSKLEHVALRTTDLKAAIARLDALGVPWTNLFGRREPITRPDGVSQIFVADPDGYWIEINDAAARRPSDRDEETFAR